MIKKLRLIHYKGFRDFSVTFGDEALLMGPNNAGKSTIINALKLCNAATKLARRVGARDYFADDGRRVRGWPISSLPDDGFNLENIRHEFQAKTSRLDLTFVSNATLHMVWPLDGPDFFWINQDGEDVITAAKAKLAVTRIGIIPTLSPVEKEEKKLSPEHLKLRVETRLSSRHFRNNLRMIEQSDADGFRELKAFLLENTPELAEFALEEVWREERMVDLFYRDANSRVDKELFWAGDGLHIWLQILFHMWRTEDVPTIVLDEPDVFLHPDLQRRLVRTLESTNRQIILTSHAAEVASEANHSSIVWIQRELRNGRRLKTDLHLEALSGDLGSVFNLAIARALKAKVALFVEGKDMKILGILAKKSGAVRMAREIGLATIPIHGFAHWPSVETFAWVKRQILGDQVTLQLLLDRDYRSAESGTLLEHRMLDAGVTAHVWKRKELESYLLHVRTISRVAGTSTARVVKILTEIMDGLRPEVQAQFSKTALDEKGASIDATTALAQANREFDARWSVWDERLATCPPKEIIANWNKAAAMNDVGPLNARRLAQAMTTVELDPEMVTFLESVEARLA